MVETQTREIPKSAREILVSFVRQVGDLDFVTMEHYRDNPQGLKHGGGGPSFDELPEAGRKILKRREGQIKVQCDAFFRGAGARKVVKVVKVNIQGQDYFIASPDTMVAYKILHLLESYEEKTEKFNTDFEKLYTAIKEIYDKQELIRITQQVLVDYEETMENLHIALNKFRQNPYPYEPQIPRSIARVLANPQLSPEIRDILEELRNQQ